MKDKIKILHIGAGTGEEVKTMSQFGDNYVTDIDINASEMRARMIL